MADRETSEDRFERLTPVIARAFVELGYRRATTAEIARRCALRENELYRLWKNKKEMFLHAIRSVYSTTIARWRDVITADDGTTTSAQRVLRVQSDNHGSAGFYQIVFSGLLETDDRDIRRELRQLYRRFHQTIRDLVAEHATAHSQPGTLNPELAAWGLIGVGAMADIDRALGLTSKQARQTLILSLGELLLENAVTPSDSNNN